MENAKHTSMGILVKNRNKRACRVVMLISMKLCFGGEVVRAVSSESTPVSGCNFLLLANKPCKREMVISCLCCSEEKVVFILESNLGLGRMT